MDPSLLVIHGTFPIHFPDHFIQAGAEHFVPFQVIIAGEALFAASTAKAKEMLAHVLVQYFHRFELFRAMSARKGLVGVVVNGFDVAP